MTAVVHRHGYVPGESFSDLVRRVAVEDGVDLYTAGLRKDRLARSHPVLGHAASEEERRTRYAEHVCRGLADLPRVEGDTYLADLAAENARLRAEVERLTQDIDECWVPLYHGEVRERRQAEADRDVEKARADTLAAQVEQVRALVATSDSVTASLGLMPGRGRIAVSLIRAALDGGDGR